MSIDLQRIRLVASREWSQRIKQRSFLVTTAVMMVAIIALVLAPVTISAILGDDDGGSSAAQVLVMNQADLQDAVADLNTFAEDGGLGDQVRFEESPVDVGAEALVQDGDADGVLTVTRDEGDALAFAYTNDDGVVDQSAALVYSAANELTLRDSLAQAGLDAGQADQVQTVAQVTMVSAEGDTASSDINEDNFRYAIAYGSALIMYMVVLIYGMWVSQGVVEEKSSRIMEIMINAATPNELMFGKVIGIGLAGLTQMLPLLIVVAVGLLSQQWLADTLGATGIDFTGIDFGAISLEWIVYFLIYFLLGFLLYAALYAGVGSLVSRQEDVQTVQTPMTMAAVLGFFGAIFTLGAPNSTFAQVVAIVPVTSPMTMVPRILLGDPAPWEIVLSIGLLAAAAVFAVLLAARIYRMGVLMYGQNPSLRVIFSRDRVAAAR